MRFKPNSLRLVSLLAALMLCLGGCGGKSTKFTHTWYIYFDTVSRIVGYDTSRKSFDAACAAAEDVLKSYHRMSDIYHEYSGMNNLKTVNDNAGVAPVAVQPELIELVQYAVDMYELTDGSVNVAMGAVLSIWHDCREAAEDGPAALPDTAALQAAAQHCSIGDVIIDAENSTIYLADSQMSLDLGAVAKGYATQMAARVLRDMGCENYVLEIGGNISAVGAKPDGTAWVAGVQQPDAGSDGAYACTVGLSGGALATSGSYQRYFELDGVRYHHIIDPDTLMPARGYQSVTVLCGDAGLADVLSTALFNMSLADGTALIEGIDGAEALWILDDGTQRQTGGFGAFANK